MKVLDWIGQRDQYVRGIEYDDYADFEWVAVERRLDAPALIEAASRAGRSTS
jgi:hypothetical protein